MKRIFNNRGLTLIELLAAIMLFSIIILLIWRVFFQVVVANNNAINQKQLQQEANLILNTVQQMHTKYTITKMESQKNSEGTFIVINATDQSEMTSVTEIFNNTGIRYELTIDIKKPLNGSFTDTVTSPVTMFKFDLKLTSIKNENISHSSSTTFSKLVGQNQGGN